MKVFVINGGQIYNNDFGTGHLNEQMTQWTVDFFTRRGDVVRQTNINQPLDLQEEVNKYTWADLVIYNFPIWWMDVPYGFKKYIDDVWQAGKGAMYVSDGRTRKDPSRKYGSGGLMQGKKYMVNCSLNAPEEAFTDPAQLTAGHPLDDALLSHFHIMHKFIGFESALPGYHLYDVYKNQDAGRFEQYEKEFKDNLKQAVSECSCQRLSYPLYF